MPANCPVSMNQRIFFFIARYSHSGVPLAQLRLAKAFLQRGFKVHFVIGYVPPELTLPTDLGFDIVNLAQPRTFKLIWPILRMIRSNQPNVIFSAEDHLNAVVTFAVLLAGSRARHSDKIICLSERDSRLLQRVYGRSATHVSSMALQDKMPADFAQRAKLPPKKFALFVGGIFYANRAGIAWFVEHVVPRIAIKICIVARGFEAYRAQLERAGKVEVIGAVEHLADWYRDVHFVIAPIFDGSGMKTKVAEALMYGKKIVGTPEAFSGYEKIVQQAGWVCATKEEFIVAVKHAQDETQLSFDPALRTIYEELYSYEAARRRLEIILSN